MEAPTQAKMVCESNHFKTCDWEDVNTGSDIAMPAVQHRDSGTDDTNKGAIIALSIVAVVCVLGLAFLTYRIHLLKKYVHRLDEEGRAPPSLTTGDYMTSAFMPLDKIVSRKAEATEAAENSESSQKC